MTSQLSPDSVQDRKGSPVSTLQCPTIGAPGYPISWSGAGAGREGGEVQCGVVRADRRDTTRLAGGTGAVIAGLRSLELATISTLQTSSVSTAGGTLASTDTQSTTKHSLESRIMTLI